MSNQNPLVDVNVGLLGCGNMGGSVLRAVASRHDGALFIYDPDDAKAEALAAQSGATVCRSASAVVKRADVTMLGFKPQVAAAALGEVEWPDSPRAVVSMLAGLRVAGLRELVPDQVRISRVMPNTPALVGAGVTGVLRTGDEELDAWTTALFEACGTVVTLDKESLFDALTAVSGSGPAYMFVAMEALADGGVRMGLPREVAMALAVETVRGAGALASQTGTHPAVLKDRVASPGGTTIEALSVLEAGGFRSALIEAVTAACERSKDMA